MRRIMNTKESRSTETYISLFSVAHINYEYTYMQKKDTESIRTKIPALALISPSKKLG
jgi:hypothetical protein